MRRSVRLLLSAACLFGCERTAPEAVHVRAVPPAQTLAVPSAPSGLSARIARGAADTVVAIGDLHGDLDAARRALRLSGAIDAQGMWIGGSLVIVQTGDQIDRGDDDGAVLALFERLGTEARASGGDVIALSGNHELMNVAGDLRYVSPAGFAEFHGENGRREAFRTGGAYANMFAERPLFVKVGDTLFVHGGILRKHIAYGLDRMNDEVRAWLRGQRSAPPAVVMDEDGPVWTRVYGRDPPDCTQLEAVLAALSAKRMVVGHTVQSGGVASACAGRLWRIDVGLARVYGGSLQVLELRKGEARVRTPSN